MFCFSLNGLLKSTLAVKTSNLDGIKPLLSSVIIEEFVF